jgi:hypothetical protein
MIQQNDAYLHPEVWSNPQRQPKTLFDFIMNAKKPSNLRFEDFKQRLEELDDYLPYLPGPLNQHLGDD